MTTNRKIILGTLLFVFTIFPITAIWHVALFQELYLEFGYFNKEESVLAGIAGLVNIVVQGVVLTALFINTKFTGSSIIKGIKFSGLIFVFYFSIQVINFVVRKEINNITLFITMEIIYMIIQFTIYGVLLGKFLTSKETKNYF